jgi:integrase
MTVSDLLKKYSETVLPLKRGGKNEAIILKAFARSRIARQRLSDMNANQFAAYRDERLRTVKASTINRELGLVQHAFEVARREWNIPLMVNPIKTIRKPPADPARTRRLRDGEWERLIEAGRKTRNVLLVPLARFAVESGMRRSELLNAKWEHVKWEDQTLHIPVTKNGHARTIPLTSEGLAILRGLRGPDTGPGSIFPLSMEAVKLAWVRLTKRAGLDDLHFHDLRHEAVSRFFERGLAVPEVALISGHKDIRMLLRYTHLKAENVAKKLNGDGVGRDNLAPGIEAP